MTIEHDRLRTARADWLCWGPYLAERAWGTVREDYSADGDAWNDLPHDHARSRAYRWNEDGLAGICDDQQRLCLALSLWNGRDTMLKERLFGLTGPQGNHGEDVKEAYFYLDSTPSHSWMRMLYKYPHAPFPYADLIATNQRRGRQDPEYELVDTGVFTDDRYFDVAVEYAKAGPDDILLRITAVNRGPEAAVLHLLPTLWFRNTWSWGYGHDELDRRPSLQRVGSRTISADHWSLGQMVFTWDGEGTPLFTENESNASLLWGAPNPTPFVKDAFHRRLIQGEAAAVNPAERGTKAAVWLQRTLVPGEAWVVRVRLTQDPGATNVLDDGRWTMGDGPMVADGGLSVVDGPWSVVEFDTICEQRRAEADAFYVALQPASLTDDERLVQRQAFAGILWSKQFYAYTVEEWLEGDPGQPAPPPERRRGRNHDWRHFNSADILSMPDTWEYPWFAAWDLAFHCIPFALIDPQFAKDQLVLLGREWFQHPNGQVPAYEWNFSDVNPPVLAWAAWRVYKIDKKHTGAGDLAFLERVFHKLLLNFTWWVNRKDAEGRNIFQGGFLGLDNIGVFDRSAPLPGGGSIDQSDGTSWMGMFCLNMLTISLELACHNPVYEDIATKFFEHFLSIAEAMNHIGSQEMALWDEDDEFFYDVLRSNGSATRLKIRSMVGLIPLFAVTTIEPELLEQVPAFRHRLEWYLEHRPQLAALVSRWHEPGLGDRRLLALCRGHRMKRLLRRMLDPQEFLSDYGIRALSKVHAAHPYQLHLDGMSYEVQYVPGESDSGLFGGNSNWRGPIWMPPNYLLIESLQQFHHYYGDDFLVESPTGSGQYATLSQIADQLSQRLMRLFLRDPTGRRAVFGATELFQSDPHWRDYLLFSEYFHGDTGHGLGASHQTGWTGLIAKLIQQQGEHR